MSFSRVTHVRPGFTLVELLVVIAIERRHGARNAPTIPSRCR
jgi:hypothetical protein